MSDYKRVLLKLKTLLHRGWRKAVPLLQTEFLKMAATDAVGDVTLRKPSSL